MRGWIGVALAAGAAVSLMGAAGAAMFQNNPIPGIDVVVQKKPCCPPQKLKTDDKGNFILKGAEPGRYEVTLEGASLRRGVIKVDRYPGSPDQIAVSMGLLLPAVQAVRQPAPQRQPYDAKGPAKTHSFTFDLPAPCKVGTDRGCTGKADYAGKVELYDPSRR